MPANIFARSGGLVNWKKIAATTSNAASGQRHFVMSACSKRSVTPRSLASAQRLGLRQRREIHRQHVEPLLGQEHAVASFAIGDRQRGRALAQQMRLALEKGVGRGAEQ